MRNRTLLELVWRGAIQPAEGVAARRMSRMLRSLLPVKTVCLTAATGIDRAVVLPDETELMAALPLGDVLAEELGIDLGYGTLVVIEEADAHHGEDGELSNHLGYIVGEALLCVLRRGIFPLERESEALWVMASSYHRLAEGSAFQHMGLRPEQFRAGLAASLGAYWTGARSSRTETSGLFLDPDFLDSPTLRSYLRNIDGGFNPPAQVPAGLMLMSGGPHDVEVWLTQVERAVNTLLTAPDTAAEERRALTRRGL